MISHIDRAISASLTSELRRIGYFDWWHRRELATLRECGPAAWARRELQRELAALRQDLPRVREMAAALARADSMPEEEP